MPSVFKLSLSTKRTRPRTLGGKPAMIFTEPAACVFFSARRIAVPAARSAKSFGAQINPANALAATTAGEAKYTSASRSPIRPLKLRFVALIAVSPFSTRPRPNPIHAPQPDGSGIAPASSSVFQSPVDSALACTSALAIGKRSEEHTSEFQSRGHLVCRLLLEKKKPHQFNHAPRGQLGV